MKRKFVTFITAVCCLICVSCQQTPQSSFGFVLSDFKIIEQSDDHGGFHGDGVSFCVLDCSGNREQAAELIQQWNELPLPQELQVLLYGGHLNGVDYGFDFAVEAGLPQIENGVYCFIDRYPGAENSEDLFSVLVRPAFNFSFAVYDLKCDILYCIEVDT